MPRIVKDAKQTKRLKTFEFPCTRKNTSIQIYPKLALKNITQIGIIILI